MTYEKFLQVVSSGQQRDVAGTKYIMPALGDNPNVMCYIDDLYVYLRARSTDALQGGRLSADQRAEKPQEAQEDEKSLHRAADDSRQFGAASSNRERNNDENARRTGSFDR